MHKIFNEYNQILKRFSRLGKTLSAFLKSLFVSKPYAFEEYSSVNKYSNYKNIVDFYLTESRRTFL